MNFVLMVLGSCARPYNDAPVECTFSSVSPQFGKALRSL